MLFHKSSKVFIHVDCDSFFASCEVLRNPKLEGEFVCVGGDIVIACTYNCKALGVKTGTPVWEAKRILRGRGIFLPPDHAYYTEISNQIFEYLKNNTAGFEPFSIDEAFCDITGIPEYYKISLGTFLRKIQKEIKEQIGVPVSIGCGETRIKAKMFSKINKPFGIYVGFNQKRELALFKTMESSAIPFIGKAYYKRIRHKAPTVFTFLQSGYRYLEQVIGKNATDLRLELMGVNAFVVKKSQEVKSISRTRSFNKNITSNYDFLIQQLNIHFERIFEEITNKNIEIRSVSLMLRHKDFHIDLMEFRFNDYTNIRKKIWEALLYMFEQNYQSDALYRSVGVIINDFKSYIPKQTSIFDTKLRSKDNYYQLSKIVSQINEKYGNNKVGFGMNLLGLSQDIKLGIRK